MNIKFLSALTATAAATALLGAAAPSQAASFGSGGISFEKNTDITFNFRQSSGANTSSLGVYSVGQTTSLLKTLFSEVKPSDNGVTGNWKGTLGNTVLGSGIATYTFLANQIYTLGLNSVGLDGSNQGTVYSTSALNSRGTQQAVFGGASLFTALNAEKTDTFQAAGQYKNGLGPLFNGGALISFDDRGNATDKDFKDFTVSAEPGSAEAVSAEAVSAEAVSAEAVPEPMTMTGLALGLGGLVAARRRRGSKTAS